MKPSFTLTSIVNFGTIGGDHLCGEARFSDGKQYRFLINRVLDKHTLVYGEPKITEMALPTKSWKGEETWSWRVPFPVRAALIMEAYPEYLAKAKVEKEMQDANYEVKRKAANEAHLREKALKEAAPDMLEALQFLTTTYANILDSIRKTYPIDGAAEMALVKGRAAITKATTIKS